MEITAENVRSNDWILRWRRWRGTSAGSRRRRRDPAAAFDSQVRAKPVPAHIPIWPRRASSGRWVAVAPATMPTTIPACASSTPATSNTDFVKIEISLDPPCIFLVPRGHVLFMLVDHVPFEIEQRAEDHELARLAGSLGAWEVRVREVSLLQ